MSNLFLFLSLRIILHPCPPFEARLGFSKKQGFLLEAFSGGRGGEGGGIGRPLITRGFGEKIGRGGRRRATK